MKNYLLLVCMCLIGLPTSLKAQGNYVAIDANNSTRGTFNTLVGPLAGPSVTGARNAVVGYSAGYFLTTGGDNSFFGSAAGQSNSTGNAGVFVGSYAGYSNTDGGLNTFIGKEAGYTNSTGGLNLFLGAQAGYANTTGGYNSFMGAQAGYSTTTGSRNVFSGYQAGYSNTTAGYNMFIGYQAGYSNTTGERNVFSGFQAGFNNTTGINNVFSGMQTGLYSTTGHDNVFIGYLAGLYNQTGSNNIIIGPNSGTAVTNSNDNVLMGYNSQAEDGLQNAIAIGANSRVAANNAMILGNQVNVGIGTSAPKSKLEVVADEADASGLRLTQLTSQSKPIQATDQFLTVNEKGDVIKAHYQLRITNASEWSDKVFSSAYRLRSLSSVASYIGQHGHLPGVPSAEQVVKEGMDLLKMNALLLEKVEELTLYSIQLEKENQAIKQQLQSETQQQQARIDQLEKQHKQEIAEVKKLVNQLLKQQ